MKYTKMCKYCGQTFETNRENQEFCHKDCRQKYITSTLKSSYSFLREPPPKRPKTKDPKVVKCIGCYYYRHTSSAGQYIACHYSIDTGTLRGIPPKDCYKKPNTPYTPMREREEE